MPCTDAVVGGDLRQGGALAAAEGDGVCAAPTSRNEAWRRASSLPADASPLARRRRTPSRASRPIGRRGHVQADQRSAPSRGPRRDPLRAVGGHVGSAAPPALRRGHRRTSPGSPCPAFRGPDDPARIMIDNDGDQRCPLRQAFSSIPIRRTPSSRSFPPRSPATTVPRWTAATAMSVRSDPRGLAPRHLRAQPRRVVLERRREPAPRPRPRKRGRSGPRARRALHAGRVRLQEAAHDAQVQRRPPPPALPGVRDSGTPPHPGQRSRCRRSGCSRTTAISLPSGASPASAPRARHARQPAVLP